MQYMNNPYMNMYPQNGYNYQQYNPNYIQQQNQQSQQILQQNNVNYLNGQIVGDIESVKSKDVNLDGSAAYYPLSSGEKIFCKKINPLTGASQILTYELIKQDETEISNGYQSSQTVIFQQFKNDILKEFDSLKNIVMDAITKPQIKGGE